MTDNRDALTEAIDVVGTFRQDPNDWTETRPKVPGELAADIIAALPSVGLVLVSKDTLKLMVDKRDCGHGHMDVIHVLPVHFEGEPCPRCSDADYARKYSCPLCAALSEAPSEPTDHASEYGRLLSERDRLISEGADPAELALPSEPTGEQQ